MSQLVIGELGEIFKIDNLEYYFYLFTISIKKCVDVYIQRMNIEPSEIYLLDKTGKTIFFSNTNDINSTENRFFIFNKVFNKDFLLKIFEENIDKLITNIKVNFPSSFSSFTDTLKIWTNDHYAKVFDKYGLNFNEMKGIEEFLFEAFNKSKNIFKSIKIQNSIGEKIKENYSYQYNSLECIYKNISNLYE